MSSPVIGPRPFDVAEICQEAAERAGIEFRAGYTLTTARRSLELLAIDWANRGLNLWTIDSETLPLVSGVGTYLLPADTVDILDAVLRTSSSMGILSDVPLTRIGVGEWPAYPNKLYTGRPNAFFVHRTVEPPQVYVHPIPGDYQPYTLLYWRLRYMANLPRGGTGTVDAPARFLPAMISGLAFMLAMKSKDMAVRQTAPALKALYEADFDLASQEDRDRSSFFFVPGEGCY
ncbi:MAG: hypothetical protein ABWY12_09775 [Burkholderiales bacterium]